MAYSFTYVGGYVVVAQRKRNAYVPIVCMYVLGVEQCQDSGTKKVTGIITNNNERSFLE